MKKNSVYVNVQFRASADGKKLTLRGYPILFNVETTVYDWWYGEIKETILSTALDGTNISDVYLLGGHNTDPNHTMGRTGINMRVEIDDTGLFFECELPNTQYARDIYNLVEANIIDGMSFGFTCSDKINEQTKTRTITHIDELFEITITPFPAYKEASVVAIRDKQFKDEQERVRLEKEQKQREEQIALQEKVAREKKLKELEEL